MDTPPYADCQLTSKMQLVTSHSAISHLALVTSHLQLVTSQLQLVTSHFQPVNSYILLVTSQLKTKMTSD